MVKKVEEDCPDITNVSLRSKRVRAVANETTQRKSKSKRDDSSSISQFQELPQPTRIVLSLDTMTIRNTLFVCREWNRIIDQNYFFWKTLVLRVFGSPEDDVENTTVWWREYFLKHCDLFSDSLYNPLCEHVQADAFLRRTMPILYAGVGSTWVIACEDRLSGELLHYTAVYFVVEKNDANSFSMRLQVIGGDDHLLEGYLFKISEDGIWEAKKSRLLHMRHEAFEIEPEFEEEFGGLYKNSEPSLDSIPIASEILMQDEVGKLMFEIIRGDHRGSVGTLQCVDYTCSTLMNMYSLYVYYTFKVLGYKIGRDGKGSVLLHPYNEAFEYRPKNRWFIMNCFQEEEKNGKDGLVVSITFENMIRHVHHIIDEDVSW